MSIATGKDGRPLAHCFKEGCGFREILAAAGLAARAPALRPGPRPAPAVPVDLDRNGIDRARRLWEAARPGAGSLVERYLATRGLAWVAGLRLRFLPDAGRPGGGSGPAMLVPVHGPDGALQAVQATFLGPDGERLRDASGKTLRRSYGRLRGGCAVLVPGPRPVVAEGCETALAALQLLGDAAGRAMPQPGTDGESDWHAWAEWHEREGAAGCMAGLGAGSLRALAVPQWRGRPVRRAWLAVDGDPAGQSAATELASRWSAAGVLVRLWWLPDGMDAADLAGRQAHD
ncbi:MAG: toprim domain-containing protein [Sphingomonadaceae bacterium]